MRIRKKNWTANELETNKHIVHEPTMYKGKWNEYFKNDNPIYLEIGCGKGRFVSENAKAFPNINFIGLERQSTIVAIAARKTTDEMNNIALIRGDAKDLFDILEKGEIKRIYINFCDPWPKKKNEKRRLTHKLFLDSYKKLFEDECEIFFKTDNRGLFEFSLNEFCTNDWKLSNITLDLHNSDFEGNIMTEYEEKFSNMDMPIYRLEGRFKL